MESSLKKCHFIKTKEFEKALKKAGSQMAKLILKQMDQLEYYENNPDKLPNGIKSPEMTSGKMLPKLNRNVYSLEPAHTVRALAHIVQKDGMKVYIWVWGGSHEDYNKLLKIDLLNKEENAVKSKHSEEIADKFNEMKVNLSKENISDRIKKVNDKFKNDQTKKSYYRP